MLAKHKLVYSSIFFLIVVSIVCGNIIYSKYSNSSNTITVDKYIKWVDFDVKSEAMTDAMEIDIETYNTTYHVDWIDILAYLAVRNGGNFNKYSKNDITVLYDKIRNGATIETLTKEMKLFEYYREAYDGVLGGMVGEYKKVNDENGNLEYGLKTFSPIAKGYYFNHYDDFGVSRSYGYKRKHLGHDLMGSVGTPIIAVESGYVEAAGWNQYGGWRIGIRSFDNKRYYYYAHLRRNHPFNDMYEGKIVNAGDVIGYLGMTGYSSKENVNNIDTPHLHYGLQLIFDKSQKDGNNQIWINMYEITKFLEKNRAEIYKSGDEYISKNSIIDIQTPD